MIRQNLIQVVPFSLILCAGMAGLVAGSASASGYAIAPDRPSSSFTEPADDFAQFTPRTTDPDHKIDYSTWGYALRHIVLGMGPSLRKGAPRPSGFTGTNIKRGHSSRLRLEGTRIAYNFFTNEVTTSFAEYRHDLERVGTELDIASLSRNEQLSYWLNLHNVAIIEQVALNYPGIVPGRIKIDGVPLDEARFIEVAGVKLSPKDIRTRIVYPNWSDPRVIYGFYRGDIGGPSIQPEEYSALTLDFLLGDNAFEFVNSLRGTERRGKTLHVSKIYEEAAPFFFPDFDADLKAHLAAHANEKVLKELGKVQQIRATIYEDDIADLARGQVQPNTANVTSTDRDGNAVLVSTRIPPNIQTYMLERKEKVRQLEKRGQRLWTIRVIPLDLPGQPATVTEIE